MSEALELLKAAGKHLKANDAPDVVELICSDFAFDDSCPADHAKKCALASFEAGRLAVFEQMINAKPVHQDRFNVFQISEGCVTLVSQGVHNTMNVESFQGCKDARQTIEWLDNREEQEQ